MLTSLIMFAIYVVYPMRALGLEPLIRKVNCNPVLRLTVNHFISSIPLKLIVTFLCLLSRLLACWTQVLLLSLSRRLLQHRTNNQQHHAWRSSQHLTCPPVQKSVQKNWNANSSCNKSFVIIWTKNLQLPIHPGRSKFCFRKASTAPNKHNRLKRTPLWSTILMPP